jgi:hypothetical protein
VNPEDDPEARIRALEQPLTDQARASELGGGHSGGDTAYLPPPTAPYTPPDYSIPAYGSPPTYGTQQYGTQPYDTQQYGTQQWGAPYGTPPRKSSAGIPWLVFGVIAIAFLAAIGAGAVIWMSRSGETGSGVSGGGGSIDIPTVPSIEIPTMPSIPSLPAAPGVPATDPNVITGAPGQTVTVSGIDENKTVNCNDATVTISGIRNTVNIAGHCVSVSVSGIENVITVNNADTIGASGFDNKVTYHAGTPQIDATGSNVVEQG